eukprot:2291699-Heterocapsa_arctica.AAC.1
MIGLLILQVDDGLWAGQGPRCKAAHDNICKELTCLVQNPDIKGSNSKSSQSCQLLRPEFIVVGTGLITAPNVPTKT